MAAITVFTDLDDSLFQTLEKALAYAPASTLTEAAHDRAGIPLSFHAPQHRSLLALLSSATLVPVTGRNADALRRVQSPGFMDYRITSHGALIYTPNGDALLPRYMQVADEAIQLLPIMQDLADNLTRQLASEISQLRARIIFDSGLPVYVSVKAEQNFRLPLLDAIDEIVSPLGEGWAMHANGRNIALLPPYASKASAVACVMEIKRAENPQSVFLGVGDSLSDCAYLKLCDFAIVPRDSQIQYAWP